MVRCLTYCIRKTCCNFKKSEFVMPVPDQARDDRSGIQSIRKILDSGFRRNDTQKRISDFL